ncbi:uncharacterized protein K441DRAFT_704223 [Cenococcum geophilum 1.58]|uniref:uncharacterized protein n=1 Tax=Cenococcum geophilum 1.58 TaxID=794803 RepID=UPI00358EF8C6|nr:hypothetical protein K441DRAFT_704223 [Cenococcum geophilum 1.58]
MTSFIPSLALPSFVFEQLAISILLGRASGIRLASTGISSFNLNKTNLAEQGATLYTIQLGLNLIWMPLFFDIVALTGVTGYLAYTWGQVDLIAGCLNNWDFSIVQTGKDV